MTTIIMIFAFPIGIFILLGEKKARVAYQATFDNFYKEVNSSSYTKEKKIKLYKDMLLANQYKISTKSEDIVVGEKKIFSIGWLFIGIGTVYVGLLIYIVYFLYFQKPHVVRFKV